MYLFRFKKIFCETSYKIMPEDFYSKKQFGIGNAGLTIE